MLESGGVRRLSPLLNDDDIDDLFELEEEWPAIVASALTAVGSPVASVCEQGLQAFARWAELSVDCFYPWRMH